METLDRIDLFKRPVPSFNIRGRTAISSLSGGIMSVIIFCLMLFYGSIKFVHLLSRHNPTISTHKQAFAYDSTKVIDLNQDSVRFAFGIEGFLDEETKDDPNYIKYLVRYTGKKEGVAYESIVDYHVCTAEELEKVGSPSSESRLTLKKYRGDGSGSSKRHLYCIDWDNIETGETGVWGTEKDDNYQKMEIVLVPCNYVHNEFGDVNDTVHD